MAETATNYFDGVLREALLAKRVLAADVLPPRRRYSPPWARTVAVDRRTLEVLPPGEIGLLRHYDLVNVPTGIGAMTSGLIHGFCGAGFLTTDFPLCR